MFGRVKENAYRRLCETYPEDKNIEFSGRDELCEFLKSEYKMNDKKIEKRLMLFERLGRDFDVWPAKKLEARAIATMDFKKYDKRKAELAGPDGMRILLKGAICSQAFNELSDEYLLTLRESVSRIEEQKERYRKASEHLDQASGRVEHLKVDTEQIKKSIQQLREE